MVALNGKNKKKSSHQPEIENSINNFEPRVSLIDVQTIPDYDNNGFNVNIVYRVVGADIPAQQLEFVLQPTR